MWERTLALRSIDTSLRDDVLALHIIEGDMHLRAHNGSAYLYDVQGCPPLLLYVCVRGQSNVVRQCSSVSPHQHVSMCR